ncbi:cytochrome P450 [Cokeromyces recurvatus]|uniref:cytochrome P450 n=1 Tax=Cokeromyces recurvatus TaxID=90255 RepID=UPI002220C615|nr:cytochrome P450 [Cokeromyces recurvatus]KAI7898137.1 cytochrome P450 [Cokeromyces recurvatus]
MKAVSDPNSMYAVIYKRAFSIVRDPLVYLFPAYTRIPSRFIPYRNRARQANEHLRKLLSDIIMDRKRLIHENKIDMDDPKKKPDLLTLMIMAAEDPTNTHNKFYLTDGELVSNLAVFFVAGDSPEDIIPTDLELKQMKYLNNCILETMRINPPTSGNLPRIVTKDTNIGGFFIPKETRVAIELYCTHHLNNYWDAPEKFNPDRFDQQNSSFRSEAVWMPFGDGPRTCIGKNFSMSEQRVVQAMFLKRYTWKLVPNSEHEFGLKNASGGGIGLLGPESLKIQLTKRYT